MMLDYLAKGVLENLVTQFSSPLDCFRELAQNSIDAGSPTVDVWAEFDEKAKVIAIHVDDFGSGMDEAIIDKEFTQLFASSKENDLTKIGKFGIGFVSVFALEPQGVLVHTGRGGEYWEVLFHADRTFTKTKLSVPVEGTQLTIFIEGGKKRYRELCEGIPATLRKWCMHSDTEITFEDRSNVGAGQEFITINEAFEVPGDCLTYVEEANAQVVVAYSDEPLYGFYNRGLTLAFGNVGDNLFQTARAQELSRIAVKMKSRWFEHTLSRDTVIRDENYFKAMRLLDEIVRGPLLSNLLQSLRALVAQREWGLPEIEKYGRMLGHLANAPGVEPALLQDEPILRDVHGRALTPGGVFRAYRRDGWILVADEPDALTRLLERRNIPVLVGPELVTQSMLHEAPDTIALTVMGAELMTLWGELKSWFVDIGAPIRASISSPDEVFLAVQVDEEAPDAATRLLSDAAGLLVEIEADFEALGTFVPLDVRSSGELFLTARELQSPMARPTPSRWRRRRVAAAVNRQHPHFRDLMELHAERPGLAAYSLARGFLLARDYRVDRTVELMSAALAMEG